MRLRPVDVIMLRLYREPTSEEKIKKILNDGKDAVNYIDKLEKKEFIEKIERDRFILLKLTRRGEEYIEKRAKEILEVV